MGVRDGLGFSVLGFRGFGGLRFSFRGLGFKVRRFKVYMALVLRTRSQAHVHGVNRFSVWGLGLVHKPSTIYTHASGIVTIVCIRAV